MIRSILLFASIILPDVLQAFPSNIRFGYNSCAACHVDATGGSLLTPYGRMFAGEVMSSWGGKTEAGLLHGLMKTSDRLDLGGDFQYVNFKIDDYEHAFSMQREVQAAVNIKRQWYLALSAGQYGEYPNGTEVRKAYLQGTAFTNWTAKVGRFFPAFGIMSNEHLYLYRNRHFNQGRETYNAELIFRSQFFELTATKIFGHPDDFEKGYFDGKEGWASRLSWFPNKNSSLGLSYLGLIDKYGVIENEAAAHVMWAFNQQFWIESQAAIEDAYFRIGVAPARGLLIRPSLEYVYETRLFTKKEINIQWFPRPHFDFQLTCAKDTWIFLSHYYL